MSENTQNSSSDEQFEDDPSLDEVNFLPFPYPLSITEASSIPVWRVSFEVTSPAPHQFGLDVNGEIMLGRGGGTHNLFDLTPYGAETTGVSRRHAMLRPTSTELYIIDLDSTNGTMCNGHLIGSNTPFALTNGDHLVLSQLEMQIHIVARPASPTAMNKTSIKLADALVQIAKGITSQLELDDVLNQVADMAMRLTSAGETSIWLVDQTSGELFLEAERGIQEEKIRRIRLPIREDNLAGVVVQTGKPIRASRQPGEDQIKVKTYFLVEALVNVPISFGGQTIGVLTAVHRDIGKEFNDQDEQLLGAIADFAAIAIQNARLFEATDKQLERRVNELSALNELSRAAAAFQHLDQLYDILVTQLNKHWPIEAICLFSLDSQKHLLQPVKSHNNPVSRHSLFMDRGILGHVAQHGQVIFSNNVPEHPFYDAETDNLNGQTPQSLACVPLHIQERVVGLLTLVNKQNGKFTNEDIDRLETFARPIANAIENARLYKESSHRWAAIQATAQALSQPLIMLDENGDLLIANHAAQKLLDTHMAQLFEAISVGVGRTSEVLIGEQTFLATTEHLADIGTIVIMQDITYVKQLEKDRAEMVHALSHDLKNPLTSIKGWTQLLMRLSLDEKADKYTKQIIHSTDRMTEMIAELLHSATNEESVQLNWQPCDLHEIINTVLRDVEGAALSKTIKLDMELTGRPYFLRADDKRLYHLVLNLVDNAIKYSSANTRVRVRLHFGQEAIGIQVQDEGVGIPEQDLPHIFEKFYRGVQANIQPKAGSGVGLAAVKAIVEAHGGRITAKNLPERGAEFTVMLPGSLRLER